jgi:putative transposase
VTGLELRKRTSYSNDYKALVVITVLQSSKSQQELAQELGVSAQLISNWKRVFLKRAASMFDDQRRVKHPVSKSRKISSKRAIKRIKAPSTWFQDAVSALSVSERRRMVDRDASVSVAKQCEWLGISRSGFDYEPKPETAMNEDVLNRINEIMETIPSRGTRQLRADLALAGIRVSRGRLRRLMSVRHKRASSSEPRITQMNRNHDISPNRIAQITVSRPNQIWQTDITYIPLGDGFHYLMVVMDVFSRMVVGWSLSATMPATWVTRTMRSAIDRWGAPEIVHSDRGTQFTSSTFRSYLRSLGTVSQSMINRPLATDNVYVERFFRSIKQECLNVRPYDTAEEVRLLCDSYIGTYNEARCHSSIGNVPPATFYRQAIDNSEGIAKLGVQKRPK